jgi:hypothetical protein
VLLGAVHVGEIPILALCSGATSASRMHLTTAEARRSSSASLQERTPLFPHARRHAHTLMCGSCARPVVAAARAPDQLLLRQRRPAAVACISSGQLQQVRPPGKRGRARCLPPPAAAAPAAGLPGNSRIHSTPRRVRRRRRSSSPPSRGWTARSSASNPSSPSRRPPFPRTNRTSLVPPLVLSGHVASLTSTAPPPRCDCPSQRTRSPAACGLARVVADREVRA